LHPCLENGLMQQDDGNERFVLFGDNAYLNTPYMATPFTNVTGDANQTAEDSYCFYHSQLHIRVKCCFGMLVQHWGILRMRMPHGRSSKKIIALINALAKLRNFCIGETDGNDTTGAGNGGGGEGGQSSDEVGHLVVTDIDLVGMENSIGGIAVGGVGGGAQEGQQEGDDVPPLLDRDAHNIAYSGPGHIGLSYDNFHQSTAVPTYLIHSGEHFIDVPESFLRLNRKNMSTLELPWTKLFNIIVNGHWERPKQLKAYDRRHSKSDRK
jgi:hypothetical protein